MLQGKIVSKLITGSGTFARVKLAGYNGGKNVMRFFDIPDEDFTIGQKVDVCVLNTLPVLQGLGEIIGRIHDEIIVEQTAPYDTLLQSFLAGPGCESPASDGCKFHTSTDVPEIGVAPVVIKDGELAFDIENIPLPEPTEQNMTERSDVCLDSQGHQDL